MPTNPYSLKNTYSNSAKVSALDLNRRADVVAFQLPGSLIAAGLDAGVLPLVESEPLDSGAPRTVPQTVEAWATAAGNAFKITASGGVWNASAGAALVRHEKGHLVWTATGNGLSLPVEAPEEGATVYIHLALASPNDETEMGALDSQTGDPASLITSEFEVEPSALLLASWDGTTLVDHRTFVAPAALSVALQNATERIEALEAASGGGEGGTAVSWLSQLLYNVAHPIQADSYIDSRFSQVEDAIEALQGGAKKFPEQSDLQMDLSAALAVGLFEVNPQAILRTQMSALGKGFGKGQNSTPDFSPDTGEDNEASYDFVTGLIAP